MNMPLSAYRMFHPLALRKRRPGGLKDALRPLGGDVPWLLGGAAFGAHMGDRAYQLRAPVPPVNALPGLEPAAPIHGDRED